MKKEDTCFVNCTAFGKMAETLNKYMRKGNPIFIEGRLQLDTWKAQDGSNRSKHRIFIENFQFLGSPNRSQQGAADRGPEDQSESLPAQAAQAQNDDIPF